MAAIVSDNDGSAFVTKAEFEALKENFASQIEQYNTSIDSKIDGAIAAYLSGIRLHNTEDTNLLVSDWKDCTMMNGSFDNDFAYPNVSGSLAILEYRHNDLAMTDEMIVNPTIYGGWSSAKLLWCWASFNYKNTKTSNGLNLVNNVTIGSTLDTSNATWAGRATNATESWALSKIATWQDNIPSHDPGYLDNGYDNEFVISQFLNLTCNGYMPSFTSTSTPYWDPAVRWSYKPKSTSGWAYENWSSGVCKAVSAIPTIAYDKDSSGNQFVFEHIGNWKKDSAWEVSVKDVTNYATKSSNNTKRTSGWSTLVTTKSAKWSGAEFTIRGGDRSYTVGFKTNQDNSFSNNTSSGATNDYQIPTIGLLGSTLTADNIYQYEKIVDSDGYVIPRLKLQQGLPLMKVKEDEIIEWEPIFKDINVTGSTGIDECRIILSYEPFTDYGSTGSSEDYVKMEGITKGEWATTTDKKVKIKFEANRNGYVYAKWVPNADWTIVNGSTFWRATLDIAKCNTYNSTK